MIEITNTGKDWAEINRYTFVGVRDPRYASLDQYGLRDEKMALLWLHDQESNWFNDKYGKQPQPQQGLQTTLRGLGDGRYRIEWWDTRAGQPLVTTTAVSKEGALPLAVPDFLRDIAAKVTRER